MDNLGETLKKVMLAGVGALATTAEKSKEILDDLVKKAVKDNVTVKVKPTTPEELGELLDKMTPEQISQLKELLEGLEQEVAPKSEEEMTEEGLEEGKSDGASNE